MEQLNTCCWLEIIKYLDIVDQMALWESCEYWQDLLQAEWQKKFRVISESFFERTSKLSDAQLCKIIASIAPTVEDIDIYKTHITRYDLMVSYQFPKIYDVQFTVHPNLHNATETRLFPNLRKLCALCYCNRNSGCIMGKHFIKWKQLEDLDIKSCVAFQPKYLLQILEELNLKKLNLNGNYGNVNIFNDNPKALAKFCKLQSIALYPKHLHWFCEIGIQNFHELKQLRVWKRKRDGSSQELFKQIDMHRSQDVEALSLTYFKPFQPSVAYKNLHKIKLVSYDSSSPFSIQNYFEYLPNLKEIEIYQMYCRESTEILDFLYKSSQIDKIHIYFSRSYFSKLELDVAEIAKTRTKKLIIYFDQTSKITVQGQSELVTILRDQFKLDYPHSNTILFR